jgi:Cytochrome P460
VRNGGSRGPALDGPVLDAVAGLAALGWRGLGLGTLPWLFWTLSALGSNISETFLTEHHHTLVTDGPYQNGGNAVMVPTETSSRDGQGHRSAPSQRGSRPARDTFGIAMKVVSGLACGVFAAVLASSGPSAAQTCAAAGPMYSGSGQLIRPADYREWVYVTTGLGMTYGPAKAAAGRAPRFDNVFVTPDAYREFLRSGKWPDKTMFILEIRSADENVSINNGGRTQGELLAIEAAVKDQQRFSNGGWGYFSFDGPQGLADTAAPLPATATCYSCHKANTAVENTFVQFYPTLFEVAKRLGTVKPTYDPARKP